MMNNIKNKVKKFKKYFNLKETSLENLRQIIQRQGYTIVEFNNIHNNENVSTIINALNLHEHCQCKTGFTYVDDKYRLVFLHKDLSYYEKLIVLAHEEGHIYLNHFYSTPILGKTVLEEYEANEFAHYLLHQSIGQTISQYIQTHRKVTVAATIAIICVLTLGFTYSHIQKDQHNYNEFYVTPTGTKYHDKNCRFVKYNDNVEKISFELLEKSKYEPCSICLSNNSK